MFPKEIQRLIDLLTDLPGVGPRQAARMAFFIFHHGDQYAPLLIDSIQAIQNDVGSCKECFRSIEKKKGQELCEYCGNPQRNQGMVCVVEKEIDIPNIEKSGAYKGLYHVLGGVFSPLDSDSPKKLRLDDFYKRIQSILKSGKTLELIIATSQNTEGDATALYLERILEPFKKEFPAFSISRLGKGLSVGTEVEYADEVTLQNAIAHRTRI